MGLRITMYEIATGEVAGVVNWDGQVVTFNDGDDFDLRFAIVMDQDGSYLRFSDGAAFIAAFMPYWSHNSTYRATPEQT